MKKSLYTIVFAIALTITGSAFHSQAVSAVNNFTISNYEVEMELDKDSDGRSTLRTVETITADFPEADENHGLERTFVKNYNGHSTSFKLDSVTDEEGNRLQYHWSGSTLQIGDADEYVHGRQTYRITYMQRDITRHYTDTKKDEFYWNAIGTEWRVPIERTTVTLRVAPALAQAAQTDLQCYTGSAGSTNKCWPTETKGTYTVRTQNIAKYNGLTVALGFTPQTFADYQPSLWDQLVGIWQKVTIVTTLIGTAALIWLTKRAHRWTYRSAELGTITPEYLPPKEASVAVSAAVSPGLQATMAAQLTDLAVRHYIQILETRAKSFWRAAEYDIKVVRDIASLRSEEQEILSDMFGHQPKVGERLALKSLQSNTAAYTRFSDNSKKLRELMRHQYGFKQIDVSKRGWFRKMAIILGVVSVLTLSPMLFLAAIVAFTLCKTLWVLSDEGLRIRRYLKGLELYIKVAEKDRLAMLQSPEGAQKIDVKDPTNPAQLVKLYERVLPYAVLFKQETQWTKRLGDYYENTQSAPSWYSGQTAFSGAVFASAISSFSSSVATTSASSSSGGSSGGGYSGGGGGGGGGGGW